MGTTAAPYSLPYDDLNEAPDGPLMSSELATAVAGWLSCAQPCLSSARPVPTSGRPMIIRETDTGDIRIYNGSSWDLLGGTGGGGGGSAVNGSWRASSGQSIPNGVDTVVGFGTTELTSPVVTRSTSGAGHKFAVSETGTYSIAVTVRFPDGSAGRRFIELRNSAQTYRYPGASQGGRVEDDPMTLAFSTVVPLTAGAELVVVAAQNSGSSLVLDYQGSSIVDGFVRIAIAKIAG